MANITRWEPFHEVVSLRNAMDRLFDESFLKPFGGDGSFFGYEWPSVDLTETGDEITAKVSLPGMKPEDVKISLTGNILNISGEYASESETKEKGVTHHLREHRYGAFSRSITLPTAVQGDKIKADYENGLVTLTLPKAEEARPKTVNIKVKK